MTFIGKGVFSGCSNLKSVTVKAINPPSLGGSSIFNNASKLTNIYVPAESVSVYKSALNWKNFASKISAII